MGLNSGEGKHRGAHAMGGLKRVADQRGFGV